MMIGLLPIAAIAAPTPLDYTLPEPAPVVQTVEEAAPAPVEETSLYRIGKNKWTDDKEHYGHIKRAQVRRVLYHTLNAADLATTVICLEARKESCREGNPIYGQSTELVVGGKILSAVLFEVFRSKDGGGEVGEWIAIGLLTAVVGNNLTVVF